LALLPFVPSALCDCESFGVDFQSGGTYFQNVESTDPFTAVQEFTGCQNDSAHNVFVDPNGDQTECTETPMQPDNSPQLLTCSDWPKDKLYDGDWSLLIISNNGDADPIAYERDFSLTVGTQVTSTVTPTITVSDSSTPVVNITSTVATTETDTADPVTVANGQGTATITPRPTTTTITKGFLTLTQYRQTVEVKSTETTVPASCSVQPTRRVKDPVATILPSILGELDQTIENLLDLNKNILGDIGGLIGLNRIFGRDATPASAKFKRAIIEGRQPGEELKRAFVKERSLELKKLNKRAPDQRTVTVTATEGLPTTTVLNNAPTTTQTITQTNTQTVTVTPAPVTAGRVTVTAKRQTKTRQVNLPIVNTTKYQTRTTT